MKKQVSKLRPAFISNYLWFECSGCSGCFFEWCLAWCLVACSWCSIACNLCPWAMWAWWDDLCSSPSWWCLWASRWWCAAASKCFAASSWWLCLVILSPILNAGIGTQFRYRPIFSKHLYVNPTGQLLAFMFYLKDKLLKRGALAWSKLSPTWPITIPRPQTIFKSSNNRSLFVAETCIKTALLDLKNRGHSNTALDSVNEVSGYRCYMDLPAFMSEFVRMRVKEIN